MSEPDGRVVSVTDGDTDATATDGTPTCESVSACRICGCERLSSVLDLGEMPPANGFRSSPDSTEPSFPLEVVACPDCSLVQLRHTVDRAFLFDDYPYFSADSGSSPHFETYAQLLRERYLDDGDLVVDVGSNDGGLLACLPETVERVGIDPAENTAAAAAERGITTVVDFFTETTAENVRAEFGAADVVCANNVLAHVADPHEFFAGVDALLAPSGTLVVEVPYLRDLVTETQLSTIYHEHLSYFSVASLTELAGRYGMAITDVERLDRHGGSIRVHFHREGVATESEFVGDLRRLERARGLHEQETLDRFGERAERKRDALRELVRSCAERGRVVGYGASAKGNVLLNYCDLGPEHIDYLVDAMPAKQGTYSPGQGVPVRSPEAFRESPPEYALLLAWNYWEPIREQESTFRETGGRFLLPTPMPDVR